MVYLEFTRETPAEMGNIPSCGLETDAISAYTNIIIDTYIMYLSIFIPVTKVIYYLV